MRESKRVILEELVGELKWLVDEGCSFDRLEKENCTVIAQVLSDRVDELIADIDECRDTAMFRLEAIAREKKRKLMVVS